METKWHSKKKYSFVTKEGKKKEQIGQTTNKEQDDRFEGAQIDNDHIWKVDGLRRLGETDLDQNFIYYFAPYMCTQMKSHVIIWGHSLSASTWTLYPSVYK